ncbi:hypothetical protein ACLB2K_048530 [Fragaria x ananassa]
MDSTYTCKEQQHCHAVRLGALWNTDLSEFVAIMADLVLGAALGTTFTVLYDAVHEATVGKFKTIKPLLGALESTLASIQPLVIKQIGDYNVKLELPNDEVSKLQKQTREGEELICRWSKLRWWNRIKARYIVQLVELDASLKGLLKHIVMQQARDIKENLLVVKQTAKQLV